MPQIGCPNCFTSDDGPHEADSANCIMLCKACHASCNASATIVDSYCVYLLSGHWAVEAALRVILDPVMPGLVIVILAVRRTAAARLWSAADGLQLS